MTDKQCRDAFEKWWDDIHGTKELADDSVWCKLAAWNGYKAGYETGYEQGQKDALAQAREDGLLLTEGEKIVYHNMDAALNDCAGEITRLRADNKKLRERLKAKLEDIDLPVRNLEVVSDE